MLWAETNCFVLKVYLFCKEFLALISHASIITGSDETTSKVLPAASKSILLCFSLVPLWNGDSLVFSI